MEKKQGTEHAFHMGVTVVDLQTGKRSDFDMIAPTSKALATAYREYMAGEGKGKATVCGEITKVSRGWKVAFEDIKNAPSFEYTTDWAEED